MSINSCGNFLRLSVLVWLSKSNGRRLPCQQILRKVGGRGTTKEFVQFLRVARGSLYELETHLIVANRLGFCDQSTLRELLAETEMIGRMIVLSFAPFRNDKLPVASR